MNRSNKPVIHYIHNCDDLTTPSYSLMLLATSSYNYYQLHTTTTTKVVTSTNSILLLLLLPLEREDSDKLGAKWIM